MSESRTRRAADRTDALFDRYTLPKVALAVILAASLVGTWITTYLNGNVSIAVTVTKWAYFVALGVVTGGLLWKHVFVRPVDLGDGATDYCAEMYARFDRIAAGAIVVITAGGIVVVRESLGAPGSTLQVYGFAILFVAWIAMAVTATRRGGPVEDQFRSRLGIAALGLALLVVVATARVETSMRGLGGVAAAVRALHLLAFTVWIGGAVWNIFVAVPTGQRRPTVPVVRAAGEQLERFRWAVRIIIPTLLLTGLYQAVDALGTTARTYLGTAIGLAVLVKVGFIGLLAVIFTVCPMWRACSPVEGVCELTDLGRNGSGGSRPPDGDSTEANPEVRDDD